MAEVSYKALLPHILPVGFAALLLFPYISTEVFMSVFTEVGCSVLSHSFLY